MRGFSTTTSGVLVGFETIRYAAQDRIAGHEQPTAAYTMLNADFRWRLTAPGGAELAFFVNGSNLADEEARKHTSLAKEIAPLPGRNFAVGLRKPVLAVEPLRGRLRVL